MIRTLTSLIRLTQDVCRCGRQQGIVRLLDQGTG